MYVCIFTQIHWNIYVYTYGFIEKFIVTQSWHIDWRQKNGIERFWAAKFCQVCHVCVGPNHLELNGAT